MSCIVTHPVPNARGKASLGSDTLQSVVLCSLLLASFCLWSWPQFPGLSSPRAGWCQLWLGTLDLSYFVFWKAAAIYSQVHSVQTLGCLSVKHITLCRYFSFAQPMVLICLKTRASVSQWPGTSLSLCKATGVTVSQLPPEWTAIGSVWHHKLAPLFPN